MTTTPKKRGRKTKRTAEVMGRIIQALELGSTRRLACEYAGIGMSTLMEWQASFPEIADQLKAAESRSAVRWLARIEKASEASWQAAAWKLERLLPDEYGRRNRTEVNGGAEPVRVEHAGSVDLNAVLEKLPPQLLAALIVAIGDDDEDDGE